MLFRTSAARLAALCLLALGATPCIAGEFTDSAGRIVTVPDHIGRVLPADGAAEVLVFVLAPDKLAGLVQPLPAGANRRGAAPALLGPITPPNAVAAITRVRPDVVIDCGPVTPERAAFADQTTQATGIPYLLLNNSIDRTPTMLREAGRLLDVAKRADDLAMSAEQYVNDLRGQVLIQPTAGRPHVYYGRGPSGMDAVVPSSQAAAALNNSGAINVAAALDAGVPVAATRQQLHDWNPDIIIAEERGFYNALLHDPYWRTLAAVRAKHVYLEPSQPFGWIDDPPGVNRLIGLSWLSVLFYPTNNQDDVRSLAQDFYSKFYGIKLSDKDIAAMAQPAGIPESNAPNLADLSLSGTGTPVGTSEPGRGGGLSPNIPGLPPLPAAPPSSLLPK
jgi:iron complex transport system substrate-binding protein